MPRAHVLIRDVPHYRRDAFIGGLQRVGFQIEGTPRAPAQPGDVLLIWNRYGHYDSLARRFEREGGTVIVAENGLMGRDRHDGHWYSLALGLPAAGGGRLPPAPPDEDRTATIGVRFGELRREGQEVIVLEQRGIGPPGIASPAGWTDRTRTLVAAASRLPVRVRWHPGERPSTPIREDLAQAACVVTWGSGAAIRALELGIPVFYCLATWIAREAAVVWTGADGQLERPKLDERARAEAFRKIGRATWRTDEIESGEPIARLLGMLRSTQSAATPAAASPVRPWQPGSGQAGTSPT